MLAVYSAMGVLRRGPDGALPALHLLRKPILVRATLDATASMVYLTALFHLPLANATAINLSSPLFIVVLAKVFLHERVDRARWLALAPAFCDEANRRLRAHLGAGSTYERSNYPGLLMLVAKIARSTMKVR